VTPVKAVNEQALHGNNVAGSINVNHAVRDRLQTINVNHAVRDRLQTTAVAMVNALVGSGSGSGDFIDNT
jgi:hypothetical protein